MSVVLSRKEDNQASLFEPSWVETTLGKILPLTYGKAKTADAGYERPGTACYGSNGPFGQVEKALTSGPTIVVGRKGAAGAVHYSPEPCWPTDTAYYALGSERTYLPYFRYLLETVGLDRLDRSTAIPSLSRDDYSSISVSFPENIEVQRRVVEEIETQLSRLEAGVSALKRAHTNLKRYRAAVLRAACEGRLTETARERFSSESSPYGEPLPQDWKWTTPLQACARVVDCHNKTAPYVESGIPLVRTTNIRNGRVSLEETRFVTPETYEFWSRRCPPEPGDVLFTREAPMGEAGIIPPGVRLCMGQRMMLMRSSERMSNRFLLIALLNPELQHYIRRSSVGSGVQHLRVGDVETLPIPLPPLAEQERIVAEVERHLSVVDELESTITANLRRAIRLRQSVLQKALSPDSIT